VQAESRLEESERTVRQLRARVKHQQHLSSASANPERARKDYSPIARGDSGAVVDRIDEDDQPQITKFDTQIAENTRLQSSLIKKLEQQEQYTQ